MKKKYRYITTGVFAGLANGFFGAGGGMILVPLFCHWLKLEEKNAFATSVAVVLPMSIVSSIVYLLRQDFSLIAAAPFLLGGLIGGLIGGRIFHKVPTKFLHKALGIFILYGGVRSLFY